MILAGCASLLPSAAGLSRFKKLSPAMKAYALLCALSSLEIAAEFSCALYRRNGIIISNIALGTEAFFILAVYAIAFRMKAVRYMMVALGVLFLIVWVPGSFLLRAFSEFHQEMAIVTRIVILVSSVIALYTVAARTSVSLTDEPLFWITSGNILYATGLIFLLTVNNDLLAFGPPYFAAAWNLNWVLIIIADALFAKGLLCKATTLT